MNPSGTISPQNGRALTFLSLKIFDKNRVNRDPCYWQSLSPPNYENVTFAYFSVTGLAFLVRLGGNRRQDSPYPIESEDPRHLASGSR
jgi:hypothetical protein